MPKAEFSFSELQRLLGKKRSIQELREEIPMLGVDLESIDEEKLIVEIFPNRPDMLSVEGFARALRGKLGIETGLVSPKIESSGITLKVDSSVSAVRPYVTAAVVRGITINDQNLRSLMDLQEKLHITHGRRRRKVAIGVHDLSKVAPPFTYKAVKPESVSFIPLDMSTPMNLKQILSDHPKGRDYAWTLEKAEVYPIILDINGDVLSFPPIINGELTRVTEETKDLFIDVTGTDEKAINLAVNILVHAFADMGGSIYSVDVKASPEGGRPTKRATP